MSLAVLRRAAFRAFGSAMPSTAAGVLERMLLTPQRGGRGHSHVPLPDGSEARMPYGPGWLSVRYWGSGPTVLLLHGWSGDMTDMAPFVNPFVTAGFRVVAFDAPAHGTSDGRRTTLIECAGAALQVGRSFGPLQVIVTHSFGAPAAVVAAKYGLTADRYVFIGPPVSIPRLTVDVARNIGFPPRIVQLMTDRVAARLRFDWDDLETDRGVTRLEAPVLVIHDRDDRRVPWDHGAAIARAARYGQLITTTGLGHRDILAAPQVIARVVEFMTTTNW